ncbi:hypothetical protein K2Q00_02405 [Patescibacteria group bacterium]|nr:hypothetical protein [Patescibacteria group bacterium]
MTKHPRIFSALTHFVAVLLGVLVGFLLYLWTVNSYSWQISKVISLQIDPLDIVTFVISVLLAVWVLRVLNKKDEGERAGRDLLIKTFSTFESDLTKIVRSILTPQGVKVDNVAAILKRNRTRAVALLKLAQEEGLVAEDSEHAANLPKIIKRIQDLLTETPKAGAIEDGIRVADGKLYYSSNHIDKVVDALSELSACIFRLTVEISG